MKVEHGEVAITLKRTMRGALIGDVLNRVLRDVNIPELARYTPQFVLMASSTVEVHGLPWHPPTLTEANDPEKALDSFLTWLDCFGNEQGNFDAALWDAWFESALALVRVAAPDLGVAPLPEGAPKTGADAG